MSTTHLAGVTITIGERKIQRCSICGYKLCDNINVAMPLNPDGTLPEYATWKTGSLIRVTEGNPVQSILLPDTDKLPDDSCIDLVEE